jgi:hypothetical protein
MATALLSIPWVRAHKRGSKWNTDIDSEYTAHEQRNALWSIPRKTWTLTFEKNATNLALLQAFFDARMGRYNAFNWVYSSTNMYGLPTGGDDVTYLVRFDTDTFDSDLTMAFGTVSLPIVQVVTTE